MHASASTEQARKIAPEEPDEARGICKIDRVTNLATVAKPNPQFSWSLRLPEGGERLFSNVATAIHSWPYPMRNGNPGLERMASLYSLVAPDGFEIDYEKRKELHNLSLDSMEYQIKLWRDGK